MEAKSATAKLALAFSTATLTPIADKNGNDDESAKSTHYKNLKENNCVSSVMSFSFLSRLYERVYRGSLVCREKSVDERPFSHDRYCVNAPHFTSS